MDNDSTFPRENDEAIDDYYSCEKEVCPYCGAPLIGKDKYSAMCCTNCGYGVVYDFLHANEEVFSKYEIALMWLASGNDPDYTFGYTEEELEDALNSGS